MKKHVNIIGNGVNIQIVLEEDAIKQLEADILLDVLHSTGKFVSINDYTEQGQVEGTNNIRVRLSEVPVLIIDNVNPLIARPQPGLLLPGGPAGNPHS